MNFVFMWVIIAASAKRLHDVNTSGWWAPLPFLIGFGIIAFGVIFDAADMMRVLALAMIVVGVPIIVVGVWRGTEGANRFGNDRAGKTSVQ